MGNKNTSKKRSHSCPAVSMPGPVNFLSFTIIRSIGKGGYGKVCIARKKDTKELFAMKYMSKNACIEAGAVRNILQELRILRTIQHPYIVNLRYAFHDIEDMVLVVDLLQGGDLRYHLDKKNQFSEHDVLIYLIELASALDYLSGKRIIHRDIKPDNILLSLSGHAHLTDFNVATRLECSRLSSSECGTWPYIAPEIFAACGYSFSVDWWSLGVTAYELLHRNRPFDLPDISAAALLAIEQTRLRYSSRLSPTFLSVLKQLLMRDPEHRITSGSQIYEIVKVSVDDIQSGVVSPAFKPSMKKLNADPSFEMEELMLESKPIHKKSSRLSKSMNMSPNKTELQRSESYTTALALIEQEFSNFESD